MHKQYLYGTITKHARRDDAGLAIGGLVLGGVVTALTSNMVAGGAIAVLGYGLAVKQILDDGKKIETMATTGMVAPFLKGDEFQKYRDCYGDEQCNQQAIHALRLGYRPSGDALDLLEKHHPNIFEELESMPVTPGKTYFDPDNVRPAQEVAPDAESIAEPERSLLGEPPATANLLNVWLLSLTQAPLQPTIIAGLPGSGKGVMTAIALSMGALHNNLKFWVFTPKPALSEAGYWGRAERLYLKDRLQQDENLFIDLMAILDEFSQEAVKRNNQPGDYQPFVLLLEEINAITSLFTPKQKQEYKAKVCALAGMLRASNMAIWVSGQSATLEDLGITGKANRSMFTAIAAIGSDRDGMDDICRLLGIPYESSQLDPDTRYWLTANATYAAMPCPTVPQYPDWAAVPNLIDLRPGAIEQTLVQIDGLLADVAQQEATSQTTQTAPPPPPSRLYAPSQDARQQLEQMFSLPTETVSAHPVENVTLPGSVVGLDPNHSAVLTYIFGRKECPIAAVKNWAKTKRGLNLLAADVDEILVNLMALQLIETYETDDKSGECVRSLVTSNQGEK